MSTEEFIIELYCRVDDEMGRVKQHSQASLHPSEVVTLALLFAIKGVGTRAFYRWLSRDWRPLFPRLPERTRLFRLFKTHRGWSERFMAQPSLLGVADSYGIELLHPRRLGRSLSQMGRFGKSNGRWICGCKLAFVLNHLGQVVGWDLNTANVYDTAFHPLIARFQEQMVILVDHGFHARAGNPPNLKVCQPQQWDTRMIVETVLSMLTVVSHFKKLSHRTWAYLEARLGFTLAAFNLLIAWHGLVPDAFGFLHLSIKEFSL